MTKNIGITPTAIHPPFARYSHGVSASGRVLLVSGQLGISPTGEVPECSFEQARYCLGNIDAILAEAGIQRRHVARINAYVTAREHLDSYMRARDEWIGDLPVPPASTLMIVSGFARPEFKVEIEATAVY